MNNKTQEYWLEVLDVLTKNHALSTISKKLGRHNSNVKNTLNTLMKKGWVQQQNSQYFLTTKGQKVMSDPPPPTPLITLDTKKGQQISTRLHHVTIAVTHKIDPVAWKLRYQGTITKLKVPSLNAEYHFQFTRTAIQFTLQQERSNNLLQDVSIIHKKVSRIIRFLERRYNIKLVRPTDVGMKKLYSELAYLKTSWAQKEIASGRRIWLYEWTEEGKPLVLFDKSENSAELELVGNKVDDNAIETAYFLKKLYSGAIREDLEELHAMKAYVPQIHHALLKLTNKPPEVGAAPHKESTPSRRDERLPLPPHAQNTKKRLEALWKDDKLRKWFNKAAPEEKNRYLRLPK